MEIDATNEAGNQSFENVQGDIPARLIDYLGYSLKKTVPGNHVYKIYAVSTLPVIKTLYKSQEKKSYGRIILLLLSEKKRSTQEEVLMTSIEIHEYYMIEEETLNIYISKVDTTGCTISTANDEKISATKQLISSYINYHLEEGILPRNKYINVHVFARSHAQYLFTRSSKNPKKHVLNDVDLLKWWKKVLGQATTNNLQNVRKWYYIPGDTPELKAKLLMKDGNDDWTYGYPYDNESKVNDVIPKFDDDAKARWLDRLNDNNENDDADDANVREFWEMVSIGGEFSGGKIAGFFWVNIERSTSEDSREGYGTNLLENLKENVGGIVFDEQEFVDILQKFFELEFYNEEIAFKASEDWSKIFDDLCLQKGINNGVLEFVVEQQPQKTSQNSVEIGVELNENSQPNLNKRKPTVIDDDSENKDSSKKINVLSPSLIKRVKK